MPKFLNLLLLVLCVACTAPKPMQVCMILDKAGKDDKSFNQAAYEGFTKAQQDLHLAPEEVKYVVAQEDAQTQQFVRSFSESSCKLIVAVGFNNAEAVEKLAPQYPNQKFAVVDSAIEAPNIRSMLFQEHEGSFLVGAIAAMKTKSNKIGFIGGMEIPLIKRFAMGYKAGAEYVNPQIKVTNSYLGVTPAAWSNPTKASEIAYSMYAQGNDVIFIAAGSSGRGVFDAAREKSTPTSKKFVIGVDSNQDYIVPGLILTSMEKKVNVGVYNAIKDSVENKFTTGVSIYNVANGGVDWTYDQYNKSLFTDADLQKINLIKKEIAENKINVPDYYKVVSLKK